MMIRINIMAIRLKAMCLEVMIRMNNIAIRLKVGFMQSVPKALIIAQINSSFKYIQGAPKFDDKRAQGER
ncbi:UNVERIFIED_CONTAM: hypothetical protein NCL1_20993 [Trichonephila clavipes]